MADVPAVAKIETSKAHGHADGSPAPEEGATRKNRNRERGLGRRQLEEFIEAVESGGVFRGSGGLRRLEAPRSALASLLGLKSRQALLGRLKRLARHGIILNRDPLEIDYNQLLKAYSNSQASKSQLSKVDLLRSSVIADVSVSAPTVIAEIPTPRRQHQHEVQETNQPAGRMIPKTPPSEAAQKTAPNPSDAASVPGITSISHYVELLKRSIYENRIEASTRSGGNQPGRNRGSYNKQRASTPTAEAAQPQQHANPGPKASIPSNNILDSASTFDNSSNNILDLSTDPIIKRLRASTFDNSSNNILDLSTDPIIKRLRASTFDNSSNNILDSASTFDNSSNNILDSASTFDNSSNNILDLSTDPIIKRLRASTFDNSSNNILDLSTDPIIKRLRDSLLEGSSNSESNNILDPRSQRCRLSNNILDKSNDTLNRSSQRDNSSNNILDLSTDPIIKRLRDSLLEGSSNNILDSEKNEQTYLLKDLNIVLDLVNEMRKEKTKTFTKYSFIHPTFNQTIVGGACDTSKLRRKHLNQFENSENLEKRLDSQVSFDGGVVSESKRAADRSFGQPTHCIPFKAFEGMVAEWSLTWPEDITQKAPAPDVALLHRVCNRYPNSWVQRALKLIAKDMWNTSQIRNPSSVLYSAAERGWLKYFPEEPPRSCELCGSVMASSVDWKCTACRAREREAVRAEAVRAEAVRAEALEMVRQRDSKEIRSLNDKLVAEYGLTVPGICRVIKQHKRTDLLAFGLEGAARIISSDPHLRQASSGLPGCPTCESR